MNLQIRRGLVGLVVGLVAYLVALSERPSSPFENNDLYTMLTAVAWLGLLFGAGFLVAGLVHRGRSTPPVE